MQNDRTGVLPVLMSSGGTAAVTANTQGALVRIAELEIDPVQLDRYKAAVQEEIETSVKVEPGVLAIYCVAEKDNPTRLRFFEIYADEKAYRTHLESAHFKKYVAATQSMIIARKLMETVPVQLSAKRK